MNFITLKGVNSKITLILWIIAILSLLLVVTDMILSTMKYQAHGV